MKIIVAMTPKGVIGKGNRLPWYIPEELAFFREITINNTIVMGRKTFESLPRKLPKRHHIVITKNDISGIECYDKPIHIKDAFIIGGRSIYEWYLDSGWVDEIIVSRIKQEYEGDVFFPKIPDYYGLFSKEDKGLFEVLRYGDL